MFSSIARSGAVVPKFYFEKIVLENSSAFLVYNSENFILIKIFFCCMMMLTDVTFNCYFF